MENEAARRFSPVDRTRRPRAAGRALLGGLGAALCPGGDGTPPAALAFDAAVGRIGSRALAGEAGALDEAFAAARSVGAFDPAFWELPGSTDRMLGLILGGLADLARACAPAAARAGALEGAAGATLPIHASALVGADRLVGVLADLAPGTLEARGPRDMTPLAAAASRGHAMTVRALLARGARADAGEGAGTDPLALAARRGWTEAAADLVRAGADPSRRPPGGRLPEEEAAAGGHADLAAFLASEREGALLAGIGRPSARSGGVRSL